MPIRKLPPLLVNQIAAGEVIDRPASVVKELVENSLDAGARRIDVVVEDGGRAMIRVSDDGAGIAADQLPLAVAPHATSKIASPDDLAAITTLGFRGEALASIASVSRLRLSSRATVQGAASEAGTLIEASGDAVSAPAPIAMAPGTVIEVRDLFFNTPARRKFLRAAGTEFGQISEVVTRLAMVHHDVAFSLCHGQRRTVDLSPTADRRQRCIELLGRELEEALLQFEADETPAARLWGLAGMPAIARATARFQYVCLNGRFIRDRQITHAIKEAYRGLIPPDRQPVAVLFIDMDPAAVDVNVHPTKAEVRFRDPGRIHGLVLAAMRQRLLGSDLTPTIGIHGANMRLDGGDAQDGAAQDGAAHLSGPASPADHDIPDSSAFVDYFRRMAPQQRGFVYEQVRQALAQDDPGGLLDQPPRFTADPDDAPPPQPVRTHNILQVHKSYLVTQDEHGLVIIDQHALHERVMFEELRRRVLAKTLQSQRLLMPEVIEASPSRFTALDQIKGLLERIGIEAEPIGPAAIGIQAFPTFLFDRKVAPGPFVAELLDKAAEGQFDAGDSRSAGASGGSADSGGSAGSGQSTGGELEAALHEVLDMMACKAAVKAGDEMSPQELDALLARRDEVERASSCPHGRPTTIRLTLHDLEKHFKRT